MRYRRLPLTSIIVNPANDRHGELENETAAVAQLFATQEAHMRSLAKDIVAQGQIFEPPLVFPDQDKYVVADGNRRTTCLKLLRDPDRAPTVDLQEFFFKLRDKWPGDLPTHIECQIEEDRDRVDEILFRRHTGVQGGIGQSNWDDRMKKNFVIRTGKGKGISVADEVERTLAEVKMIPESKIPRSNMNRLLSSEAIRNKLGFSISDGSFQFIRDRDQSLLALSRVADDLARKKKTLDDIWDTKSKRKYMDELERDGILPTLPRNLDSTQTETQSPAKIQKHPEITARPTTWPHLIPEYDHGIIWVPKLHRHREIWDELQFRLVVDHHPNATAVLSRVLIEISLDNYISSKSVSGVTENDSLARKCEKVARHMNEGSLIDFKYMNEIIKIKNGEDIISISTLNRYVHSSNFDVSPRHIKMIWNTFSKFVVICLSV
ncbi:hypothetical protein [Ancylobacter amanitiformis]|uniref:ParB/Sulfiredoxin domain-containing protein n=1 Tax=Ancylobacter amanitiformis TaxID=217069 RepID=A0ABU0LXC7_9HYPH|nr:hypothetical protein [Ancylobacter amanitiformis]MDQ0513253.1 hypothetical protein [Ancylobacter amanitiformis]